MAAQKPNLNDGQPGYWSEAVCVPIAHEVREFDQAIVGMSPAFIDIYNQSAAAEAHGLDMICGPGYRKALEFLIKDYLGSTTTDASMADQILKLPLGTCIEKMPDPRVKSAAKRAAWLGNDETHYVRKWETKDLSDLKVLIELTIHWILMENLARKFETSMSDSASPKAIKELA